MSLELSGTTPAIKGVAGSVSAPALTGDDANTGISFPSANTIKFSTGGVERISITDAGISGTGISGGGITVAAQFRLTTALSVGNTSYVTLSANWANVGFGVGSFSNPSSGIFSFPSTGIYLVRFNGYFEDTGNTPFGVLRIQKTSDGSNYSAIAAGLSSNGDYGTYDYCMVTVESFVDVTNTANDKVFFEAYNQNTATLDGNSNQNRTYVTFIRLGDT